MDPLTKSYPMLTPYQLASNGPIANIDLDGLESFSAIAKQYFSEVWGFDHTKNKDARYVKKFSVQKSTEFAKHAHGQLKDLQERAQKSSLVMGSLILFGGVGSSFGGTGGFILELPADIFGAPTPLSPLAIDDGARALKQFFVSKNTKKVIDFFGGARSKIPGALNVDLVAEQGVRGSIKELFEFAKKENVLGTVDEIVANNPQASFLIEAGELLKSGGTLSVKGNKANKFFQSVFDGTAEGLGNFDVISKNMDVLNEGFKRTDGTPIQGQINEIILKKK